jgi:hypothetical protein
MGSSHPLNGAAPGNSRAPDPAPSVVTRAVRRETPSGRPSGALRILICGSGAGGHVLAGLLSARGDVDARVFTMNSAKVVRWRSIAAREPLVVVERDATTERTVAASNPGLVTDDPREAARGCDLALFVLPAFLHPRYLSALAPFLEDGCVIVGLPGQPGFEFDVREILRAGARGSTVMNFDSLPWICRLAELGRRVTINGTKERLTGAMQGDAARARLADPVSTLQELLGPVPRLEVSGHVLGITLRSPNASNHPPMMYSRWRDWDGRAVDAPPLFYEGIDQAGADLLERVSEELVATAARIMALRPEVDLTQVIPQYQWEIDSYGAKISDHTNLMTAIRTNAGYAGITHPMVKAGAGGYCPDFGHRFLAEDIPFGLVVMRGVAELAGVPTPHIDSVIAWGQERLGAHYLAAGRLTGADVCSTRCPQRYGMRDLDAVLGTHAGPAPAGSPSGDLRPAAAHVAVPVRTDGDARALV